MPEPRRSRTPVWMRLRKFGRSVLSIGRLISGRLRAALSPGAASDDDRYGKSRAHFWDEVREGRRHAEAHSGKRDR